MAPAAEQAEPNKGGAEDRERGGFWNRGSSTAGQPRLRARVAGRAIGEVGSEVSVVARRDRRVRNEVVVLRPLVLVSWNSRSPK